MVTKLNKKLLAFLLVVGLLFLAQKKEAIPVDDFYIEDDFQQQGYTESNWEMNPGVTYSVGQLSVSHVNGADTTYLKNLKERDIKTKVELSVSGCTAYGQTSYFTLELGNHVVYTDSITTDVAAISKDIFIELIKHTTDPDTFSVIINGEQVSTVTIPETTAMLKYSFNRNNNCGTAGPYGGVIITYLKSRPFFNCILDSNEVWVRDRFAEGTTFDITDLKYTPTKFCLDSYPAVLRDLDLGVRVAGDVTKSMVLGEAVTVPANSYIEVSYATLYQAGIMERCGLGEVWNNNKSVCEGVLVETEEVYVIIREHEYIIVGSNQHYFTNNLVIGDKSITSGQPDFVCDGTSIREAGGDCNIAQYECNEKEVCIYDSGVYKCKGTEPENWNAPEPQGCWQVDVTFDGITYTMQDSETISLNQYLDLTLYIDGHYDYITDRVDSYTNNYVLTLKNRDFLQMQAMQGTESDYWVILNDNKNMCFQLSNDLANFNSNQAGFYNKYTRFLLQSQGTEYIQTDLPLGSGTTCIPVDTTQLGEIMYEITPYFYLGNDRYFDNEKITYTYNIVNEIPTNVTIIYQDRDCNDFGCPNGGTCQLKDGAYVCVVETVVYVDSGGTPTEDTTDSNMVIILMVGLGMFVLLAVAGKK